MVIYNEENIYRCFVFGMPGLSPQVTGGGQTGFLPDEP